MGWTANSVRSTGLGVLTLGVVVLTVGAQPNPDSEARSGPAPEKPRIAIETTGPTGIGDRLASELVGRGYPVIDATWLARTTDPNVPDPMPRADLIVSATVRPGRERRQQGRYRVNDTIELKAVDPRNGRSLLFVNLRALGESFDGFPEAHESAVQLALTGRTPPLEQLFAALDGYCDEERRLGLDLMLSMRDHTGGRVAATLARDLASIPGIVADSIRVAAPAATDVVAVRFRYRGTSTELPLAIFERIERIDANVAVRFASSPRFLAVQIDPAPSAPAATSPPPSGDVATSAPASAAAAFGQAMDGVISDAVSPDRGSLATRAGRVESTVQTPTPIDGYLRVPIVVVGGVRASALARDVRERVKRALLDGKVFRELDDNATTVVHTHVERISGSFLLQTAVEDRSRKPSVQLAHHGRIVARPLVRQALQRVLVE